EKAMHYFEPMHKEIVFNRSLQHNDGLLTESYMQSYHTDFRKAQKMLGEDVAELNAQLRRFGKVAFDQLGSLTLSNEGKILYQPAKTNHFDVDYYGLSSFHFPVLPAIERNEAGVILPEKRQRDIFYLPVNMRFIRGAVAMVAAIALFLIISTPVKDVQQAAYTASILPHELLSRTATDVAPAEETTLRVEETVATPPVEAAVAEPVRSNKNYHIVIGSFPNAAKANEYLSTLDLSQYPEIGTIVRDNRHRVFAKTFDNKQDAETFLLSFRETGQHKDAWLFVSRN
ncbi:SPOR domain-containing protein, partial [Parabacteroides sp. OttesenSCG-928-G06]|nr:SPOR domain-containing protein [Parabacteroides sp. OttesenSCG-928-G06]